MSKPIGPNDNLRKTALQGGAYLIVRELVGMVIRVIGVIIITRKIGPGAFGIYSGAAAFISLVVTIAQMGMEIYLIRQPDEPTVRLYNEVFTFLVVLTSISVILGFGLSIVVEHLHPSSSASIRVFQLMLISVPLNALWAPAQAKIERSFGFRKMAGLELGGDLVLYCVAVPLCLTGSGAYSLVYGVIAWQAFLLIGSYRLARMLPRLCLPSAQWFAFLRHGMAFASASSISSVMGLANPIVVGRYFGATGVGYVALAGRLADTLGFAQRATWRLGLVALSKVQSEGERAKRGIEEGAVLQLLMVAVPMVTAAILGKLLIPLIFGTTWLPALDVFALFGVASIINAPLTVQMALLYSRGKNNAIVLGSIFNAIIVYAAAFLFVPHLGVDGYGVALILSTLGWLVVYRQARKIQNFDPTNSLPWILAFVPPVMFPLASWPENLFLLAPLLLLLIVKSMRVQLGGYTKEVVGRIVRLRPPRQSP